jgi:membrane protease YdiL (CAAX protease family)
MGMKRSYKQRNHHEKLIRLIVLVPVLLQTHGFVLPELRFSIHTGLRGRCNQIDWKRAVRHSDVSKFPTHQYRIMAPMTPRIVRNATPATERDDDLVVSTTLPKSFRRLTQRCTHWLRRLRNNPHLARLVSVFQYITNESVPTQVVLAIALYLFHLTVLTQHLAIFGGNYIAMGYDSVFGAIICLIYYSNRIFRGKSSIDEMEASVPWNLPRPPPESPIDAAMIPSINTFEKPVLSNNTTGTSSANALWSWLRSNRILSSAEFAWIRFRISMMITMVALVKAYFQTGTYSLFWEDLLYSMSAAGWPLTIPLSRSIQVLAGHLTWVAAGTTILWALPRPPPFFRSHSTTAKVESNINGSGSRNSNDAIRASPPYQWFRMSFTKCNWLWWTIGGYFVSSWLFNIADAMNRSILPAQVLQDAAESVVTQLVQPEHNDVWASVIGYIAPCVTAPVWEELLYRGFLLAGLTAWTGSWHFSCVLQAVLFSAHHMSITAALPLAVLGYTWAVLYTHSRNLWTVIAVHAMWNSRVFFGSWFGL